VLRDAVVMIAAVVALAGVAAMPATAIGFAGVFAWRCARRLATRKWLNRFLIAGLVLTLILVMLQHDNPVPLTVIIPGHKGNKSNG
jgi:hypothetical protein